MVTKRKEPKNNNFLLKGNKEFNEVNISEIDSNSHNRSVYAPKSCIFPEEEYSPKRKAVIQKIIR